MWHALVGQASGPTIPVFGEQEMLFKEKKNTPTNLIYVFCSLQSLLASTFMGGNIREFTST